MSNSRPARRPRTKKARRSLRIPDNLLKAIRQRAQREHLDEATAIRQLLAMGATEYALHLYRGGQVTLSEAADIASVTPREMLEILWSHGVKGNITLDQQRKAIEYVTSGLKRESTSRYWRAES